MLSKDRRVCNINPKAQTAGAPAGTPTAFLALVRASTPATAAASAHHPLPSRAAAGSAARAAE